MSTTTVRLRYGSMCSGIESTSVAWMPLGLLPAWFAEIDPFANAVLNHHYREVPNLGDMNLVADQILQERLLRLTFSSRAHPVSPLVSSVAVAV